MNPDASSSRPAKRAALEGARAPDPAAAAAAASAGAGLAGFDGGVMERLFLQAGPREAFRLRAVCRRWRAAAEAARWPALELLVSTSPARPDPLAPLAVLARPAACASRPAAPSPCGCAWSGGRGGLGAADVAALLAPLRRLRRLALPEQAPLEGPAVAALASALPGLRALALALDTGQSLAGAAGLGELEELEAFACWCYASDGLAPLAAAPLARSLRRFFPRDYGRAEGFAVFRPSSTEDLARFEALESIDNVLEFEAGVTGRQLGALGRLGRLQRAGFALGTLEPDGDAGPGGGGAGAAGAALAPPGPGRALRRGAPALAELLRACGACLARLDLRSALPLSGPEAEALAACGALEAARLAHSAGDGSLADVDLGPYEQLAGLGCALEVRLAAGEEDRDEVEGDPALEGPGPAAAARARLAAALPRAALLVLPPE
eukprot:tig00000369_g24600.t1